MAQTITQLLILVKFHSNSIIWFWNFELLKKTKQNKTNTIIRYF